MRSVSGKTLCIMIANGVKLPFAVMENEDDVTTKQGDTLGVQLENTLSGLWELYIKNRHVAD